MQEYFLAGNNSICANFKKNIFESEEGTRIA